MIIVPLQAQQGSRFLNSQKQYSVCPRLALRVVVLPGCWSAHQEQAWKTRQVLIGSVAQSEWAAARLSISTSFTPTMTGQPPCKVSQLNVAVEGLLQSPLVGPDQRRGAEAALGVRRYSVPFAPLALGIFVIYPRSGFPPPACRIRCGYVYVAHIGLVLCLLKRTLQL